MFKIKIARTVIEIKNHFEFIHDQCLDYLTDEPAEFNISMSLTEIEQEKDDNETYSLDYCESIATYRKICQIIIQKGIFLFHGSFFSYLDKGIMFIGPSGVGKTTQMNKVINKSPRKFKIINGDKPLFVLVNEELVGYGTPWSGKENRQLNTSETLKAIYVITQSDHNHIEKLTYQESIHLVLNQLFFPNYKDSNLILIKIFQEVIVKIPTYRFYNTLDHDLSMEDILKMSN